jgi:hypothetical protein
MKTPQEIFDAVWTYFVVEGHPQSISSNAMCRYRGKESNCAVGCQLPDALYDPVMESKSIYSIFKLFPEVEEYFGETNKCLLSELQNIHDWEFPRLKQSLEKLAVKYGLTQRAG